MARRANIQNDLYRYMVEHEGQVVFLKDLVKDTGLTEAQVKHGMYHLYQKNLILKKTSGNAWEYDSSIEIFDTEQPVNGTGQHQFDQIGRPTKDGGFVIQDVEGNYYKATPLEW